MTRLKQGMATGFLPVFWTRYTSLPIGLIFTLALQLINFHVLQAQQVVQARQVVPIPREGFPYCQPFTGSGPFDNAILGGEIRIPVGVPENNTNNTVVDPFSAKPTGQSLQLTPYDYWHSGYAIVDIPFSSQSGIKTSFEYFSYGGPDANGRPNADGISFFMFDADKPLQIGYLGGSLAYAPYIELDGSVSQPGIAGGYVGIGFDERGNFGVGTVGKPESNWLKGLKNSITIRGPENFNYNVVDRFVTTTSTDSNGNLYTPENPQVQWFNIDDDGTSRTTNCALSGYRKVFIELTRVGAGYQIKIDMQVNTQFGPQHVSFSPINYPYVAPARLKIGFAGSTGYGKNNHEIRNVTVNVSDNANLNEPEVDDQKRVMCVGDNALDIEFKARLSTSDAFITCLQLFTTNPGSPNNNLPPTKYLACGLDPLSCVSKCNSRFYQSSALDANGNTVGTFTAELQNLNTGNFNQLRDVVNVKFTPQAGFSGEAYVFYNVTDNYGFTSEPKKITIRVNPFPAKTQDAAIYNPSCEGQRDGRIYDLKVGSLVDGFDYEWLYQGNSIGQSGASVSPLSNGEASFELSSVNLGTYTLRVWNPSDNATNGCPIEIDVEVDQEDGTPVILDVPDKTICEGETVSFLPTIDPQYNPSGSTLDFLWYSSADRSGGALIDGSTITLNGNPVQIEIVRGTGELILSGLKNYGSNSTYEFFVEAAPAPNPSGNFCPYRGTIPTKATAIVTPPLGFNVTHDDDWCLANAGKIVGVVTGASDVIYTLLDNIDQVVDTNVTGEFTGLSVGEYKVYGTSSSLGCGTPIKPVTIEGPASPVLITPVQVDNSFCSLPNGSLEFSISGGNLPYQSVSADGALVPQTANGEYVLTDLAAKSYLIEVIDARGCSTSIQMKVEEDPASSFTVIGSEVCEGMVATANIATQESSTGTPQFKWYLKNSAGDYVEITDGFIFEGVTYGIGPAYELSATGYSVNSVPYEVFLRVTGDRICDQGYIQAELKVTPGPPMDAPVTTAACHGENNGTIQAKILDGDYSEFEFSLVGDNGVSFPFAKNNGFFDALPAGTYGLSIRNSIGCVTTLKDIVITQPDGPITVNQPSIERASCNLPNGQIKDLVITGGWGNYTVEWRKGAVDGPIISGGQTGAADLLPDTYFLIVTDGQGCQSIFDFEVVESSDPVYQLVPALNACEGEAITLKPIHLAQTDPNLPPTSPTEVKWYKNPGQVGEIAEGTDADQAGVSYTIDDTDWINPSLEVKGLSPGTHDFYFYVVCTGQEIKAEVSVYAVPEVEVITDPVSCFENNDGKVTLTSGTSPEYTYKLNGGAAMPQADLEALNLVAGDYEFEVQTPAGCPQQFSFTVEGPEAPLEMTPLVGVGPGCGVPNGKIQTTISGGWTPYTVTVRDPDNPLQTFTTSEKIVEIDGLVSGFYSIEVVDGQNCVITSPDLQLVDGPTQVNLKDQQICEGQAVTLVPNIDPPSADAVYNWYLDAGHTRKITSNSSPTAGGIVYNIDSENGELTITGLSSSSTAYQYFIEVTGAGVCQNSGQASVMVYSTPTASAVPAGEVCFGEGGTITINASGGSGEYMYSLDGATAQESNIFTNVPVGTHTVLVQTPETCEVLIKNIVIAGPAVPLKIEVVDTVGPTCSMSNGEITIQLTGGYDNYSVEILRNQVSQGNVTPDGNGVLVIPNIGEGDYEFLVTDAGGCTINLSEPLNLIEVPTTIQADDKQICEGDEVILTPEVPANIVNPKFSWYFDQNLETPVPLGGSNGVTHTISPTGELSIDGLSSADSSYSYFVMVEGQGICAVVPKKVQVSVNQYPTLRVSNPSIICDPNGTVDLTNFIEGYNPAFYDYTILSPLGDALVGNELNSVDKSGNYEVSVASKGSSCWTALQRILVRISEELLESSFQYHADLGGGVVVSNETVQLLENVDFEDLSRGNVLIWEWDFGDGNTSNEQNPSHIYQSKGTYTVTLKTTDSIGCQSIYAVTLEVKDDFLLMMPNAFTPDGTRNQLFKPVHRGLVSLEFYVFNTWGELIYHSDSLEDQGWDGTFNGEKAPNGNYVYKVKYKTRSGDTLEKSGVFILIR